MRLRLIFTFTVLLLSACASEKLIQSNEEFATSKNDPAVKVHLKIADAHFSELKSLQAHSFFPNEFNKVKNKFSELMKTLENNEVQLAIQQEPELIKQMIQLEIETLKQINLAEAMKYIQDAKKLDASDYAPNSLKQAESLLQTTQALIEKSFRDKHAISEESKKTLQSAKKLYFISKEARAFHKSSDKELEQQMISHYDFLSELGSLLKLSPLETQGYVSQRNKLIEQIKNMKSLTQETQACPPVEPSQQVNYMEKKPIQPKAIISQETNKAVLPELFSPRGYSDQDEFDEENLEFDAIEIVK